KYDRWFLCGAREGLDAHACTHFLRKEIIGRESSCRHALSVSEAAKCIQRFTVLLKPVRKRIAAKIPAPFARDGRGPRHGNARSRQILDTLEAAPLGLVEGLEEIHRRPRVVLENYAAHRNYVHDRIDAGCRVILCLLGTIVRIKPRNLSTALC